MHRLDSRRLALLNALAAAALATWGCSASHAGAVASDAAPDGPMQLGEADASLGDAGVEAACSNAVLPLFLTGPDPSKGSQQPALFVPATVQGQASVFQLDTGSPLTFLHEPLRDGGADAGASVTRDAGSVELACDVVNLIGIGIIDSAPVNGKPCLGTLGDDRLLARPVKLDIPGGQVLWNEPGTPFAEAASWPSAAFDRAGGYVHIVEDVTFDGTPVKLFVDTGSPDSLWVGQSGRPGDVEADGEDSQGDVIKMYRGTVTLGVGSFHESVTVYRVPSFPYFTNGARRLGAQVDGLLGLSAIRRGAVFDTDARRLRVHP